MKKLLVAAVISLTGCGLSASDEYKNAVPTADTVQMKVPGSTGQALETASTGQALLGDKAAFYELTRGVSVFVNGAGYQVLTLVKTITDYPPTTLDQDKGVAVWGPYTEALSPNTWRLTVTKKADKDFTYLLEAKAKTDPDTAFLTILSGEHLSTGKVTGHGTFVLDMDAAQKLPEHDPNAKGKAAYTYSHDSLDAPLDVQADFTQVLDKNSMRLIDATYKYTSNDQTGGSLEFQFQGDVQNNGSALENMTLNSRWDRSGAGRSDVKVAGGDIPAGQEATATECWDSNFASRYLQASFDPSLDYGDVSACGKLSTAEYSSLRL
jgi:hypothetical protein